MSEQMTKLMSRTKVLIFIYLPDIYYSLKQG